MKSNIELVIGFWSEPGLLPWQRKKPFDWNEGSTFTATYKLVYRAIPGGARFTDGSVCAR